MPFLQDPDALESTVKSTLPRFGVLSDAQTAHFLAQCAAESGELQHLTEDLNYSAIRLLAVWPNRFKDIETAALYAHNPEKLANLVYGGRLGNTEYGDGWRYRGRGCFNSTGRANYLAVQKGLNLPVIDMPDLLGQMPGALQSAALYWSEHKLNMLADIGDLVGITRAINGGINGLGQRAMYLARFQKVMT